MALRYAPFGDRKELADGLVESAFNLAFIANQPLLWNRQAFEQRLQQGRHQLVQAAQQVEKLITSILQRHHDILFQINSEKSCGGAAGRHCRYPLSAEQLFPPHWLQCIAFERLQQYPRYLDGILMRFKRLQGNIERDHQFTRELDRLWQQYRQRKAKHDKDGSTKRSTTGAGHWRNIASPYLPRV
ncbi:MAG: DUF3418 domain-containing protein [Gammaproteobacteria bacterium]